MSNHRQQIGMTGTGETLEIETLNGMSDAQRLQYSRALRDVTKQAAERDEHFPMGTILFGLARARYTRRQMRALVRANTLCDLIFVNSDLVGVAATEYVSAGDTPLQIARPTQKSRRVEFWMISPYRNDAAANDVVADLVVSSEAQGHWQWDYVYPELDTSKAEAYTRLGLTALTDGSEWVLTVNGSGIKGSSLMAKAPTTGDNPILAESMAVIHTEAMRLQVIRDVEWARSFPASP